MTIDEAICHAEEVAEENYGKATEYQYQCNELSKCLKCGDEHMQLAEWLKDYKRLKEQEPCEDAISRQAVEDKLLKLCNQLEGIFANIRMQNQDESVCGLCEYDCPTPYECPGFDTEDCFKLAYEIRYEWQSTEDLHFVKPQERTGHWNLFHTTEHGMREDSYFKCNRCNYESYKEYNFCPDCGAKMVEPQERSE